MRSKVFLAAFLLAFFMASSASAEPLPRSVKEGWGWPVLFLAPQGGWEGEAAQSIGPVLQYVEKGVNDSVEGIKEHDVVFEREATDGSDASSMWAKWKKAGFLAVVSFASSEVNQRLIRAWKVGYPPLLLVNDDVSVIRDSREAVLSGVYSLQLHRSFTTRAMVERAVEVLPPASEVAVISNPLAEYLSRCARSIAIGLREKRLTGEMFWVSGAAGSYNMTAQETLGFGADMIVFLMNEMGTGEFFREVRCMNGSVPLCYGMAPVESLLGLDGLVAADQDYSLEMDRSTRQLKTDVWDVTRVRVKDRAMAAKAYAACQWILGAFKDAEDVSVKSVTEAMARVKGIPLGTEILNISPVTHRPARRIVTYLRVNNGRWIPDGTINLSEIGPGYYFDTPLEQ